MKVMGTMKDVNSFYTVLREALSRKKVFGGHIFTRKSYDATIHVDIMPQACRPRVVLAVAVWCFFVIWVDEMVGQGG